VNSSGPGIKPCISKPPKNTAVTALPGIPKVKSGIKLPPVAALFALSEETTPARLPLPNSSRFLEDLFASL